MQQVWSLFHSFLWMCFFIMSLCVPFIVFEIEVLKHFSWFLYNSTIHVWHIWKFTSIGVSMWMKILMYTLFFHLFICCHGLACQIRGSGLLYYKSTIHGLEPLSELLPFKDRISLITPSSLKLGMQFVMSTGEGNVCRLVLQILDWGLLSDEGIIFMFIMKRISPKRLGTRRLG